MPEKNDDDVLYHYCNVEAFLNIIQHSKLWLSDVLKSNDCEEVIGIRDKVNSEIVTRLSKFGFEATNAWNTWIQQEFHGNIYAACFSEHKDTLSQWRGYADDGKGLVIGFSKTYLQQLQYPCNLRFGKVKYYDKDRSNSFIKSAANTSIKKMNIKGIGHVALEQPGDFLLQFPFYKNNSFSEEKEWRIVLISHAAHKGNFNFGSVVGNIKIFLNEPQFRINNDKKIVSYVEMDFSKVKREIVKEICIGPKSKVTQKDIVDLLNAHGYYDVPFNSKEPIPIHYSKSTYKEF